MFWKKKKPATAEGTTAPPSPASSQQPAPRSPATAPAAASPAPPAAASSPLTALATASSPQYVQQPPQATGSAVSSITPAPVAVAALIQPTMSSFSRPPVDALSSALGGQGVAAATAPPPAAAATQQGASSGGAGQQLQQQQQRERRNWQLHELYVQRRFEQCQRLIDELLADSHGLCEYALYVNGLIKRHQGSIEQSLQLFQAAAYLNPSNRLNTKQIARSLHLLGRHQAALAALRRSKHHQQPSNSTEAAAGVAADIEDDADEEDWEVLQLRGLCRWYLGDSERAVLDLRRAIGLSRHDATYELLAKVYIAQGELRSAIDTLVEGLEFSPESPSMLTTLGLLYLRHGDTLKALDFFSSALSTSTTADPRTTLAAGAIVQDHGELDAALGKYRQALRDSPLSAPIWNNIAMCFFARRKFVACIAALKKAYGLAPFEWMIAFNLGLVHLLTGQFASAFLYFSASISLKPDFASSYMYLGICLNRLDDFENARIAYEKGLSVEGDFMTELNYSIMLFNRGFVAEAEEHFRRFETLFSALDSDAQQADPDVPDQASLLNQGFAAIRQAQGRRH